jgi:flagellar biosynthesis anti-sigma factor FlgM
MPDNNPGTKKSNSKSAAAKLDDLEQQLFEKPATDSSEEKIKQVRAAIESGEYNVDPEKIAEKMIDFESKIDD